MTVLIPDADLLEKASQPDAERRFGGLRRLHGVSAYEALRAARVAVVGVGGVGSWTAEALARSGVARLVLIDLDNIAESNINRQVHALESTLGQAKVVALKERIAQIHPECVVEAIEEFVDEANVAELLKAQDLDGVIDCCDQVRAKTTLAAWAVAHGVPFVTVGAAGGKRCARCDAAIGTQRLQARQVLLRRQLGVADEEHHHAADDPEQDEQAEPDTQPAVREIQIALHAAQKSRVTAAYSERPSPGACSVSAPSYQTYS